MLRMPNAEAPNTSDCRPMRVRRVAICMTGSAPFWTASVLHAQWTCAGWRR